MSANLPASARSDDDVADAAASEAVEQVVARQQRRRRDHHRSQLDRRQHHLPQRHDVAQHQQDAVAPPHALGAQEVGDAVRALGELGERQPLLASVLAHHPQRRPLVALRMHVEPVERPVELVELRPFKAAIGRLVVVAVRHQEFACLRERLRRRHHPSPPVPCAREGVTRVTGELPVPLSRTRIMPIAPPLQRLCGRAHRPWKTRERSSIIACHDA